MKYKKTVFVSLAASLGLIAYFWSQSRVCKLIDAEFERTGEIVVSQLVSGDTTMRGQDVGSPEYLDGMLDALPNDGYGYRYGETLPKLARVTIKPETGIFTIVVKLPDGTESASLSHKMDCVEGFWAASKKIYSGQRTDANYNLIIDQLRDGTLRVQRLLYSEPRIDDDVPAGTFHVMAHFRRISP